MLATATFPMVAREENKTVPEGTRVAEQLSNPVLEIHSFEVVTTEIPFSGGGKSVGVIQGILPFQKDGSVREGASTHFHA
jgi:hypothetical protein